MRVVRQFDTGLSTPSATPLPDGTAPLSVRRHYLRRRRRSLRPAFATLALAAAAFWALLVMVGLILH